MIITMLEKIKEVDEVDKLIEWQDCYKDLFWKTNKLFYRRMEEEITYRINELYNDRRAYKIITWLAKVNKVLDAKQHRKEIKKDLDELTGWQIYYENLYNKTKKEIYKEKFLKFRKETRAMALAYDLSSI